MSSELLDPLRTAIVVLGFPIATAAAARWVRWLRSQNLLTNWRLAALVTAATALGLLISHTLAGPAGDSRLGVLWALFTPPIVAAAIILLGDTSEEPAGVTSELSEFVPTLLIAYGAALGWLAPRLLLAA